MQYTHHYIYYSTLTHIYTDSPPPIGFLPQYLSDPNAASHISGVDLSYGMQPVSNQLIVTTPETILVEDDTDRSTTPLANDQTPSVPKGFHYDYSGFDLLGKKIQVFINLCF